MEKPRYRKIIHVDMDAFYASVEQRDNPDLRGKPIAVGGSRERGVVAAASYEARKFGVHSAMPSVTASRLCPHLIFVRADFEKYKAVSEQIREIFFDYTDLVEPLSLDEAYLDVTKNKKQMKSATMIAEEIRQRIFEETNLTASAGISINKFVAKVASDLNKPNGLALIPPERVDEFIKALPISKFHGIGKVTAEKMKSKGIVTGADLQRYDRHELVRLFGKSGAYYYQISRGEDRRPVRPDRIRKSVGAERTFSQDKTTREEMESELLPIAEKVSDRLKKNDLMGKTVTLKIKDSDFQINTRSQTFDDFVKLKDDLFNIVKKLLEPLPEKPVRLLGISVSNLNIKETVGADGQLTLNF
ncbi:DNA polymerase IV [Halocola ammonii]